MHLRRTGDRQKFIRSAVGAGLAASGVALKFILPHSTDWLILGIVGAGAGLISPSLISDAIKAWRSRT